MELAEKARAADPGFPIVLMTGHVQEEAQARIAHGDFDVLRKPFEPHQLLAAIAATLEQRRYRAR